MTSFKIESIKAGSTFSKDLFLDLSFLLEPARVSITRQTLDALKRWGFDEVTSEASMSISDNVAHAARRAGATSVETGGAMSSDEIVSKIKRALEDVEQTRTADTRLEAVQNVYNEYASYINYVYTRYATHTEINKKELSEVVMDLYPFISKYKRFLLRVMPSDKAIRKNFIVHHSMRSTIFAIIIGLRFPMTLQELVELGVTCIIHEIGMIRLPPQLYLTNKRFSPSERMQMMKHPIFGFEIAKALEFSTNAQRGILEHHERENGTGYPRKLVGERISLFAKIIAVACTYESITTPRNYKEARSSFDAMVEMLKNENNQYDGTVIKALLYSLSLFPIGAYVFLVNGGIAQVIDVSPENPRNPIVELLGEKNADGSPKTVQTDEREWKILRVLSKEETADAMKSIKLKEKMDEA